MDEVDAVPNLLRSAVEAKEVYNQSELHKPFTVCVCVCVCVWEGGGGGGGCLAHRYGSFIST